MICLLQLFFQYVLQLRRRDICKIIMKYSNIFLLFIGITTEIQDELTDFIDLVLYLVAVDCLLEVTERCREHNF